MLCMFFHDVTMQERSSSVECEVSLGELILVKLRTEPFMGLDNQWFCDKITVKTPEGDEILFPCYRWLGSDESIVLQPARGRPTCKLDFFFVIPVIAVVTCSLHTRMHTAITFDVCGVIRSTVMPLPGTVSRHLGLLTWNPV